MTIRHIVKYPHEALTTPAEPVEVFDEALAELLDDLAETMYAEHGVGLAANQIAVLKRALVLDTADPESDPNLLELVNPKIVEQDGVIVWEEGCLSFPELFERVERAAQVRVAYRDRHGEPQEIEAEGLLSVALQHEIDHLDGVVFVARVGPLARTLALKRFEKIMAERRIEGIAD